MTRIRNIDPTTGGPPAPGETVIAALAGRAPPPAQTYTTVAQGPPRVPLPPQPALAVPQPVNAAGASAIASAGRPEPGAPPAWIVRDMLRVPPAAWLPQHVRPLPGETPAQALGRASQHVLSALPPDARTNIEQMHIPTWLVALTTLTPKNHEEIVKQLRFMASLHGAPPSTAIAARFEQLLIFTGSAQTPTPGSNATGRSLGDEGCTAAICKYIIAELKSEFPRELAGLSDEILTCEDHNKMLKLLSAPQLHDVISVSTRSFRQASFADFPVGGIAVQVKPGGTHVLGWSRVASGWGWTADARQGIGNTGLPQYGERMILSQEYVSGPNEPSHNDHGPLNGLQVIRDHQNRVILNSSLTNPYAAQELAHPGQVSFTFVRFLR